MSSGGLNTGAIITAVEDQVSRTGLFDTVNAHAPVSVPGNGITAALWVQNIKPVRALSGLNTVSLSMVLVERLYTSMRQEPYDAIDPNLSGAATVLMNAYAGAFTLGGLIESVDVLGQYGPSLESVAGWAKINEVDVRCITLTVPCIVADVWTTVA